MLVLLRAVAVPMTEAEDVVDVISGPSNRVRIVPSVCHCGAPWGVVGMYMTVGKGQLEHVELFNMTKLRVVGEPTRPDSEWCYTSRGLLRSDNKVISQPLSEFLGTPCHDLKARCSGFTTTNAPRGTTRFSGLHIISVSVYACHDGV